MNDAKSVREKKREETARVCTEERTGRRDGRADGGSGRWETDVRDEKKGSGSDGGG